VGTKLDALVKVSIVVAVLFASASVGYYYLAYLPRRDAQLDLERALERERAEAERRAERERAEAEKREEQERIIAEQQRQSAEKAAAQNRYQACLSRASANYDAAWARMCKRYGDMVNSDSAKGIGLCVSAGTPKVECEKRHKESLRDTSANCTLPKLLSADLNADLEKARDRCLQETRAGLQ
jgi:hypothetical protein